MLINKMGLRKENIDILSKLDFLSILMLLCPLYFGMKPLSRLFTSLIAYLVGSFRMRHPFSIFSPLARTMHPFVF